MVCLFFLFLNLARAQTSFEGWFRIEKNREHIGYVLQRVSVDPKTHARTLTSYVRTKVKDADFFEFTQANADAGFRPRNVLFVTNKDAVPYQIASEFRGESVYAHKTTYPAQKDLARVQERTHDVIGAFVLFVADLPRMKDKIEYSFHAYAEERARLAEGTLGRLGRHTVEGLAVYQLGIDYLGQYMESFTAEDGTPLGARNLAESIVVFWVPDRRTATGDLPFNESELAQKFGPVPPAGKMPWAAIKDAQLVMQAFPPPPRRLAGAPAQPPPALPMRSR